VSLVNGLATSWAGGREVSAPATDAELRARATAALRDVGALRRNPTTEQARGLEELARALREIFAALEGERSDEAAARLNRLFAASGAVPHLHRTGNEPWHLHFHLPDAGLVKGWSAGCAVGLAYALGSGHSDRLGICAGPGCERVFVDLSKNGSRRFCSTACQNRVKATSFRARRRGASR
jgi:predicted RNA-binding Zn ribbon-like protein